MAFTNSSSQTSSIENPTIPQEFFFDDCFSIIFNCTEELIEITPTSNPTSEVDFSVTTSTSSESFLVPSDVLCSCTPLTVTDLNTENTFVLREIFSSLPISLNILNQILPDIGETARRILSRAECDSNSGEITVNVRVRRYVNVDEDSDFYNDGLFQNDPELAQLVNLLERSKIDEQDEDAECAICLEKFGQSNEDSSVEVIRTNCSHVFHDGCMLRWLRRCANCQSPYSCPLCRCIVFPTSQSDDE